MRMLRRAAFAATIAAILFATWTWHADGAWHYGAIPTEGMIRVNLLGLGALVCLVAGWWFRSRR